MGTEKAYVSIGFASKYLDVSIDALRNWDEKGLLVAMRTGGKHRRYRLSDLVAFKAGFLKFMPRCEKKNI